MAEFVYNNSYQVSIGKPPIGALYSKKCQSPLYLDDVGKKAKVGPDLVAQLIEKI